MTHPMTAFVRWALKPPQVSSFRAFESAMCILALDGEDPASLPEVLSRQGYNFYFGAIVEALATIPLSGAQSFATQFGESPDGRATPDSADYCRQLQKAPMRLYRVRSVAPGEGFVLHDMDAGREDFVHDVAASRWFEPGFCVAGRIVDWNGREELSGGFLPFSAEDGDTTARETAKYFLEAAEDRIGAQGPDALFLSREFVYLNAWLAVQLDAAVAILERPTPKRRARAQRSPK